MIWSLRQGDEEVHKKSIFKQIAQLYFGLKTNLLQGVKEKLK